MSNFIDLDSLFRERDTYPNPCDYEVTATQIKTWLEKAREVRSKSQREFVCNIAIKNCVLPYPRAEIFSTYVADATSVTNSSTDITITGHSFAIGDIVEIVHSITPFLRNFQYEVSNTNFGANTIVLKYIGGSDITVTAPTQTFNLKNKFTIAKLTTIQLQSLQDAQSILSLPRLYLDFSCKMYSDINFIYTMDGKHPRAKFVLTRSHTETDETGREVWIHYTSPIEQVMRFRRNDQVKIRFSDRSDNTIDVFNDTDTTLTADPFKQTMITLEVTPYLRDNNYDHTGEDTRVII